MSEVPVTPETPAQSAQIPAVEAPLSSRQKLQARLSRVQTAAADVFNKSKAAEATPTVVSEPVSGETPNPETVEAVAKVEEALGEEVAEQKPNETKSQYETRIARLTLQIQREEGEKLKFKKSDAEKDVKIKELEAILENAKKGPKEALALAGWDPVKVAQAMANGELTQEEVREIKAELPPEVRELLEEAKRLKAEKAERDVAEQKATERKRQVDVVETAKAAVLDKFPVLELVPTERLLDAYLAASASGEEPEFEGFAEMVQKQILSEATTLLSNVKALKAVLASKPELKELFRAELGGAAASLLAPGPTESRPVSKTLTNAATAESPTKGQTFSERERLLRAKAVADRMFERK